ncbi:splicing factor 3B subunit 1-like [Dorcoceras hygrometricum]|uniref:Splicing factor 3B subunit 1-like n=1 Tax=Dorcoceras hygrometricum TaxID=472368 RepID=A0A2Z7A040_9LAMI|nr:splicing factor 3B subunit 1-like [Dorcoceras hygrometricum]
MEEPSLTRSDDIVVEDTERSIAANDKDDNIDGAENVIARKMASFTAPKQFLKDPLRSGEDDDTYGFEQPKDSMLPSVTAAEITRIQFERSIEIRGVQEGDWYKASLPKIPADAKGKAPLKEIETIKGHPAREIFTLISADIEFLVQLRAKISMPSNGVTAQDFTKSLAQLRASVSQIQLERVQKRDDVENLKDVLLLHVRGLEQQFTETLEQQEGAYRGLVSNVRQEVQLQKIALSLEILESRRKLQSQQVSLSQDMENKWKGIQDQQTTLSHDLMEFRVQAQENFNTITSQLSGLVHNTEFNHANT